MLEKKIQRRKSLLNRTSSIITNNENNIEKVNLDDYTILEKVGKTSCGYIYICKNNKSNKVFLMKILPKFECLQNKTVERLSNEYAFLSTIYHPFIIELKGINNTNPLTLNFLFEYIPGGYLSTLLKSHKRFSIKDSKFYLASLITIIDYLHKKNIIHRDLRPENILINKNGYIKLADFSFAKKMESHDFTYSMCGSPEYYSPEMINKSGYNISTDFWELGILLYEMLVGCTPFMDPDPIKIYQKITKNKVIFPQTMNKSAKEIIKHFLVTDVNKRLGCTKKGVVEIIESPFFAGFDWRGLLYRAIEPPFIPVVNGPMDTSNYMKTEYQNTEENEDNIEVDKKKDPFYNW
jgi:protein kinase X